MQYRILVISILLRLCVDKRVPLSSTKSNGWRRWYTLTLSAETDWVKAKTNDRVAAGYDFIFLLLGTQFHLTMSIMRTRCSFADSVSYWYCMYSTHVRGWRCLFLMVLLFFKSACSFVCYVPISHIEYTMHCLRSFLEGSCKSVSSISYRYWRHSGVKPWLWFAGIWRKKKRPSRGRYHTTRYDFCTICPSSPRRI